MLGLCIINDLLQQDLFDMVYHQFLFYLIENFSNNIYVKKIQLQRPHSLQLIHI